jgi:LPS-assembly protein
VCRLAGAKTWIMRAAELRCPRFRFSTAILACQLVFALAAPGVPAQSTATAAAGAGAAQKEAPPTPGQFMAVPGQGLEIVADQQEKFGHIYHLRGNVELQFRDMYLTADQVDYDETTGDVDARGHVRFSRQINQEEIAAQDAHYNINTERGQFYEVRGSIGARPNPHRQRLVLTTTNPYYFEARRVDKVSEDAYMMYDGFVTSCRPSEPIWTFATPRAKIKPGQSATIYDTRVKAGNKVPFFFSPFFYHSLKRMPRSTGFLTPHIGNSSRKGLVFGEGFFWAINRSADATGGIEYYSKRGLGERGEFRFRPAPGTIFTADFFGVLDRGLQLPNGQVFKQGGRTLAVAGSSELPHGFRAVANFNYLSSFIFRLAFTDTFNEAVNTEVHSSVFLSNNFRAYSFNFDFARAQDFQSFNGRVGLEPMDIRKVPGVEFNSFEHRVFAGLPLFFSFDAAAEALTRDEPHIQLANGGKAPGIATGLVGRLDFYPRVTLPLEWKGFHLMADYGVRATHYAARLANGRVAGQDLERDTQEVHVQLRPPSLERVFDSPAKFLGDKIKHVIEPRAGFHLVDGLNDFDFHQIIRFDERDLVTETRELEYGIANRLFSKRSDGVVREMLSWDLVQHYYFDPTFGGALVPGQRNVFLSTIEQTGYAFLDGRRRFSPVTSTVRFLPAWNWGASVTADYDPVRHGVVNTSATLDLRRGNAFASLGESFLRSAPDLQVPSNQIRGQIGYGFTNRRGFNVGATFVYDIRQSFMLYSSVQANYNFDCCGLSFEFRRFQFGAVVRDERQFRVAISFANIGTFGNLKKQERMF